MAWSTPRTWTTGELVTAAHLNQEVRDNLNAAHPLGVDAWTSYTPTLVQSGAVTKTVTYAKYQRVGRLVVVNALLAVTGSGSASNAVAFGLPVAAANASSLLPAGTFLVRDASASTSYQGAAVFDGNTSEVKGIASAQTNFLGAASFTAGLASGDVVAVAITYEAAS